MNALKKTLAASALIAAGVLGTSGVAFAVDYPQPAQPTPSPSATANPPLTLSQDQIAAATQAATAVIAALPAEQQAIATQLLTSLATGGTVSVDAAEITNFPVAAVTQIVTQLFPGSTVTGAKLDGPGGTSSAIDPVSGTIPSGLAAGSYQLVYTVSVPEELLTTGTGGAILAADVLRELAIPLEITAAETSASPSPSASDSSDSAAPVEDEDDGGSALPWIIGGVVAVIVIAGIIAAVVARRQPEEV